MTTATIREVRWAAHLLCNRIPKDKPEVTEAQKQRLAECDKAELASKIGGLFKAEVSGG